MKYYLLANMSPIGKEINARWKLERSWDVYDCKDCGSDDVSYEVSVFSDEMILLKCKHCMIKQWYICVSSTCEKRFSFSAMKSAQRHQRQLHGKDTTDVSLKIGKRLGGNSASVKKSTKNP